MKRIAAGMVLLAALLMGMAVLAEEMPVFPWERDLKYHWQLDDRGAARNRGAHKLDAMKRCTVCGSYVLRWSKGGGQVYECDAVGNLLRRTEYDESGAVATESIHVLSCAADGTALWDVEYVDGVLRSETVSVSGPRGMPLTVRRTTWESDGTAAAIYYDERGCEVYSAVFSSDGSVEEDTVTRYAPDGEGGFYEAEAITCFSDGVTRRVERSPVGDIVRFTRMAEDGTLLDDIVSEYGYENGRLIWVKSYSFGRLAELMEYEEGHLVRTTEYAQDGGWTISTWVGPGQWVTLTWDANGNLME